MASICSFVEDGLVVNELQRMMLVEDTGDLFSSNLDSFGTLTLARRTEDDAGSTAVRSIRCIVYLLTELGFPATVGIAYATLTDIKGSIFTTIGVKTYEEPYVDPRVTWVLLVGDLISRLELLVRTADLKLSLV